MVLEIGIVGIFLLLVASIVYWTLRNGISPMPTSSKVKKALLDALPEQMEGTILELGSGWGTLAYPLAEKYPHCRVIGYETSLVPYLCSRLFCRLPNLTFQRRDFMEVSLSDAACIVSYLYPAAMQKLAVKCASELQKGALIVTHTFRLPDQKPDKAITVSDLYKTSIYFYIK